MDKRKNKSPEWRAKISATVKERWSQGIYGERNSRTKYLPRLSGDLNPSKRLDVRIKISEGVKRAWLNPEVQRKTLKGLKLRKHRLPLSPEERQLHRDRLCKQQRKLAETEEGRMKMLRNILDHTTRRPNKSELKLDSILQRLFPGEWQYVGDGSLVIGGLNPDFMHNTQKKILELFGRYWHETIVDDWKRTEFGRTAIFSQLGYECIIIYDDELTEEKVLAKLGSIRVVPQ